MYSKSQLCGDPNVNIVRCSPHDLFTYNDFSKNNGLKSNFAFSRDKNVFDFLIVAYSVLDVI